MASNLILASRSPQRRAILEQLGVEFIVEAPDVEELTEGEPRELALENARRKSRAVEGELVLGVDTVVALRGSVYGKPADESEAEAHLEALSGQTHEVLSGLALRSGGDERAEVAVTAVRFRRLDPAMVRWYVASGEWRERAGGYAVQGKGAALVEYVEGDYSNVVGLPISLLVTLAPELLSLHSAAAGPAPEPHD